MFDEAVEVIVKLFTETTADFAGKHYQLNEAYCEPKPVQRPHPPIVIGGGGEKRHAAHRRAGRSTGTCPAAVSTSSDTSTTCCRGIATRSVEMSEITTSTHLRLDPVNMTRSSRRRRHLRTPASTSASSISRRRTRPPCSNHWRQHSGRSPIDPDRRHERPPPRRLPGIAATRRPPSRSSSSRGTPRWRNWSRPHTCHGRSLVLDRKCPGSNTSPTGWACPRMSRPRRCLRTTLGFNLHRGIIASAERTRTPRRKQCSATPRRSRCSKA